MILYVETNFLILICLICKNNKNLLINAKYLKILSVSRHFERNVTKWNVVEKSPAKKVFRIIQKAVISPFHFVPLEMTKCVVSKCHCVCQNCRFLYFGLLFDVFL